MILKMVFLFTI
ncbi:RHS repeat-associated core domain protein, partial [Escherichia coli 96.0428]